MIQLEKFCKCYGTEKAVDNLSFEVLPGQVLGLIGRNGAGKTSTQSVNRNHPANQREAVGCWIRSGRSPNSGKAARRLRS